MSIIWEQVARGIVSPEGPAVDRQGNAYLVSRWMGRVIKVDVAGHVDEVLQTHGKPQAVALLPHGDLLVVDAKRHALFRITPDGRLITVLDNVDGMPLLGPNDLVIGTGEVVYFSDPGLDMEAPGQVVRVNLANGEASILVNGLLFPNGITISDDGCYLYVAESTPHRIWRYEMLENGRRLGPGEVFHQFDDFHPDGIAFDATGRLLVTLCGGGTLAVLSPHGELVESISTGGTDCTNCVFGGEGFQMLYLTEDKQEALLRARWPVPGQRRFSRSLS